MQLSRWFVAVATLSPLVPALAATPIALVNPGFETAWTASSPNSDGQVTFFYHPSGPNLGWTFGTSAGFASGVGAANSYGLIHAYEGNRFAFLQIGTEPLSQAFTLAAAGSVDLSFELSLRPGYRTGQVVRVLLDGQAVADIATRSTPGWELKTVSFGDLAAGQHTLAFQGKAVYAVSGDTTAYLDDVKLAYTAPQAPVPEPSAFALMAAGLLAIGRIARRRTRCTASVSVAGASMVA